MARSPSRRDDDRYTSRRDDRDRYDRGYRPRSRSRGVRYRSRSPGRRDLIRQQPRRDDRPDRRDRRDDRPRERSRRRDDRGDYRPRDRSRGTREKRSRDRSPVRDRDDGRLSRDDGSFGMYGNEGRKRRRHDSPPPRCRHGDTNTGRKSSVSSDVKSGETSRPTTADAAAAAAAEEAKKAKLAKVEAWKKKQLAEKLKKEGAASPAIKTEGASASPAVRSPTLAPQTTTTGSPAIKDEIKDEKQSSPMPYAGKFDPKAIAKRAAAKLEKSKAALDGGAAMPKSAAEASQVNGASLADNSKVAPASGMSGTSRPVNGNAKISGFGLNKAGAEKSDKPNAVKPAAHLDEDDQVKIKLEKLPDMPAIAETGDTALANAQDNQDEGVDGINSDEAEAEAAREAAQKRAQEAQAEQEDVAMTDAEDAGPASESVPTPAEADVAMEDEEEIDPLDAFMNDLTVPPDTDIMDMNFGKRKKGEPQVFSASDDEGDLDVVGDGMDDIAAIALKRKKKDIPSVNHGMVQYEPFRRAFYAESDELAEMTTEELDILRSDLDNITVRGKEPPKPILKWSQGGFGAQILDVIRDMKFEKPTPIQAQTLPAIMSGRDTIGIAKTGSGKTVAYLLPMFRHIKDQRPLDNLEGPIGLVLAPTRELATQIHRDCKPYLKALNLRAVCAYGGAPIKDQIAELKRGAEIVVCTPGRMIDLLAANSGRVTNLKRVTYVVLDEADRMFDMGFEPQITKILNNIRPDRQTVLFSATFPKSMENLARKALAKPLEIIVGGRSVVASEITQVIEVRTQNKKVHRLLELLGQLHEEDEDARSLVFVERQETADNLAVELNERKYPTVSIHGGRDQIDRDEAISNFKAGIFPVMVATSVAARGLDVKQLKLVVNFDAPNHIEDYVHRSGRTGRAGNTGTAVTFVTPEQDRFASFLIRALNDSKQPIPDDLKKLQENYEANVKAGKAQKTSSGFGGRGIERLDASRDAERAREKKQHKLGDEPEEEEEKKDEKKTDKNQSEVDKLVAKAAGQVKDRDATKLETPPPQSSLLPSALSDHLSKAMKVEKRAVPVASGSKGPAANDPLARVNAAVASINSRLGAKGASRPGGPVDNRGPDAGAFHATLEINDFPQKARWGVTNRTNVAKILDATGTSITTKGEFYPPGKEPEVGGQPKLYILVEGDTEVVVEKAMGELTARLREGAIAAMESESKAPTGRYSVV